MTKHASVTTLSERIKRRDAKRFRAKVEDHNCVLNRRAVAENVMVTFATDDEQHALHVAFNEPTCAACVVCSRLKPGDVPAMTLSQQARWRGHWARMVAFSRLLEREHVRAGVEILAAYQCTRGMDEMLFLTPRATVSEDDGARLIGLGWKSEGGKWYADYEPMRSGA